MPSAPRAQRFIQTIEAQQVVPLNRAGNLAAWEAATTGSKRLLACCRPGDGAGDGVRRPVGVPRAIQHPGGRRRCGSADPTPAGAAPSKISQQPAAARTDPGDGPLQSRIEQRFATFRARTSRRPGQRRRGGAQTETDSATLEEVWRASSVVGAAVAEDVRAWSARNAAARTLGFPDYHAMWLHVHEQDRRQVDALFDETDTLTRDAFTRAKAALDERLADRLGASVRALMPRHHW